MSTAVSTSEGTFGTSRKEFAHREKRADKREHYEYDLVDVVLAGRQAAHKVRQPEDRIIPQRKPGPAFTASVRDHGNHHTEEAHSNRGHANSSEEQCVVRTRPHGDDQTEN